MKRIVPFAIACALALGLLAVLAGRPAAEESAPELSVATGTIKVLTLPMEGPTAGKLYFELTTAETGVPTAFKVDTANQAAIALLTAARAAKAKVRVTFRADFTVTELEVL